MSKFRAEESRDRENAGKKRDSYKSKRSFTRNKGIRKAQQDKPGRKPNSGPFRREDQERAPERSSGPRKPAFGDKPRHKSKDEPGRENARDRKGRPAERSSVGREDWRERRNNTRDRERPKDRREKSGEKEYVRAPRNERPPRGDRERKGGSRERDSAGFREKRIGYSDLESPKFRKESKDKPSPPKKKDDGLIRLNKYLSNAGVASRREADRLIESGAVKVNGQVVDQLGYKIKPGDKVTYGDQSVKSEKKVYLLLNKPKDYITTVEDPRDRKTVMDLIAGACRERVYPVGRLDRNTTGLLLLTNDGELTTKLTHPKFGVKKVYHVTLNRSLKVDDFRAIIEGVELEDGLIKADDLAFVGEGKKEVGIEIHSGRNRVVRRLFEHLGYDVIKLDRVIFAGLTKKDLPRGKYRFLTPREVGFLQMIG